MPTEAEQAELEQKYQEIQTIVADMETRLQSIPCRKETEEMRGVMFKMVAELHRMEHNIAVMLQIDDRNGNGGNANGDY